MGLLFNGFGRPQPYVSHRTHYTEDSKDSYDMEKVIKFFHNNFEATSADSQKKAEFANIEPKPRFRKSSEVTGPHKNCSKKRKGY